MRSKKIINPIAPSSVSNIVLKFKMYGLLRQV